MSVETLVDSLRGDPQYVKFLLVERPYIRESLTGGSVLLDDEARSLAYPTTIGNSLHCDLIELEEWLAGLSPQDRKLLLDWAESEDTRPVYGSAVFQRRRGERRVARLLKNYGDKHVEAEDGPGSEVPEGDLPEGDGDGD